MLVPAPEIFPQTFKVADVMEEEPAMVDFLGTHMSFDMVATLMILPKVCLRLKNLPRHKYESWSSLIASATFGAANVKVTSQPTCDLLP